MRRLVLFNHTLVGFGAIGDLALDERSPTHRVAVADFWID